MLELYLILGLILSLVMYKQTMKKVLFVILLWPAVLLKGMKGFLDNEKEES